MTDLQTLLASLSPSLYEEDYVFCSVPANCPIEVRLAALSTFHEPEGLSIVITRDKAEKSGLDYAGVFRLVTLQVHSSLSAVGLTAAVAQQLASRGISANVIAAFYHDHILVPSAQAEAALAALQELSG